MKKFLITAALVSSFLIFCFSWLSAGGDPYEGHTWDERANGIGQNLIVKGAAPAAMAVVPLGKTYILIWREQTVPAKWQGPQLGGFSYFILRGR
jgi:hypothetical protein